MNERSFDTLVAWFAQASVASMRANNTYIQQIRSLRSAKRTPLVAQYKSDSIVDVAFSRAIFADDDVNTCVHGAGARVLGSGKSILLTQADTKGRPHPTSLSAHTWTEHQRCLVPVALKAL